MLYWGVITESRTCGPKLTSRKGSLILLESPSYLLERRVSLGANACSIYIVRTA